MSDIFISYSNKDKDRAALLAEALAQKGWSVWWDHEIPPGKSWDEVIEAALNSARCVIVLWSKESVSSNWVKTEAREGVTRSILIPVLMDRVQIPLEFKSIQAADLYGWQGDVAHAGFKQLWKTVASMLDPGVPTPPPIPPVKEQWIIKHAKILISQLVKFGKISAYSLAKFPFRRRWKAIGLLLAAVIIMSGLKNKTLDEETEPNDHLTSANVVEFGTTIRGKLSTGADRDFFVFKTPSKMKDKVTIIMRKLFYAGVDVYDADEHEIKSGSGSGDTPISFTFDAEPNSSYYLLIKTYDSDYHGDYELVIR